MKRKETRRGETTNRRRSIPSIILPKCKHNSPPRVKVPNTISLAVTSLEIMSLVGNWFWTCSNATTIPGVECRKTVICWHVGLGFYRREIQKVRPSPSYDWEACVGSLMRGIDKFSECICPWYGLGLWQPILGQPSYWSTVCVCVLGPSTNTCRVGVCHGSRHCFSFNKGLL
jgi:hypothetical protein